MQALNLPSGNLLDNQDLLSCGPLHPLRTIDEWRRNREEYLRTLYAEFQFSFADFHRDLLTNTRILLEAESVTVWVGTGLAEQLLLAWMPQFLRVLGIDLEKLQVIQFSNDPNNGEEIQSVGILSPDKLKEHPPPMSLGEGALTSLDAAWALYFPLPNQTVRAWIFPGLISASATLKILNNRLAKLCGSWRTISPCLNAWQTIPE